MRVLLRDLAPGQEYAIQFRSNDGENVSEWSQVQRFTTTDDVIAPSQVTNLAWFNSGPAFIAVWDPVTTQATNPPTELRDFRHYRCNVSDGVKDADFFVLKEKFELTKEMNVLTFGSLKTALTIKVYAVDMTYNESVVSTATINPANPPVPSAPTLSMNYGTVLLEWNGRDAANATMPANIDYVEVHIGTTNNFTASASTLRDRIVMNRQATVQRSLIPGLTNGTQYWARLIAVNVLQKSSGQSAVSNALTKTNLTGLDIANGQISAAQINFTARDIGGANAYYSTSQPTGGTYKQGDIWYDTDNGYTTYRHDGTTWQPAPEIGVISGTKILAGTVTADAVGTNLLITAKANIGNAIIDSSHIDQLTANVITAGVVQSTFTVNYGGVVQPAWKLDVNGNAVFNNAQIMGQMVVGNSGNTGNSSYQIKSWNFVPGSAGWAINGDGTVEFGSATMRGSFRTATVGRRVEILSAGATGTINFWAPDGDRTYIRSVTEANLEQTESIQIGVGDPNDGQAWNRIVLNIGHGGHMVQRARIIEQVASTQIRWFVTNQAGNLAAEARNILSVDYGGWAFRDGNAVQRLGLTTNGGIAMWSSNGFNRVNLDDAGTTIKAHHPDVWFWMRSHDGYTVLQRGAANTEFFNTGEARFNTWSGGGSVNLIPMGGGNNGWLIISFSGSGYGTGFKTYADNRGAWSEFRQWNDQGWAGVRSSNFEVISDARGKDDIRTVKTTGYLDKVKSTRVAKYKRKRADKIVSQDEIGLIAQEAPQEIVSVPEDETAESAIDLYKMSTLIWGALQELSDAVEDLRGRVKK